MYVAYDATPDVRLSSQIRRYRPMHAQTSTEPLVSLHNSICHMQQKTGCRSQGAYSEAVDLFTFECGLGMPAHIC